MDQSEGMEGRYNEMQNKSRWSERGESTAINVEAGSVVAIVQKGLCCVAV
jgi:hypothetical protein